MELTGLLDDLHYSHSPNFIIGERLPHDAHSGHIFRKAQQECSLRGVYTLRGSGYGTAVSSVPAVYVCEARTDEESERIHRRVWNQNIVPFVLVTSPTKVRLYSGFHYEPQSHADGLKAGVLHAASNFNQLSTLIESFKAESIDDGSVWRQWGDSIRTETRVDWRLLENLDALDHWLMSDGLGDRTLAHAIIGKYIFLHYLRQRDILSDRKLEEWGIAHEEIFSRGATLDTVRSLLAKLDEWLNGSVFPLSQPDISRIGGDRLRRVAGIFGGDRLEGQLHLNFDAYDFRLIPIETLSVIYEKFLHSAEGSSEGSEGRRRGAYYTPIPLVNLIIDTLNEKIPLKPGGKVVDTACGSGAFLVQCYRKLIEERIRETGGAIPRPVELRTLLNDNIFGVDTDDDACRVAELSLILTLLDYVHPPDLTNTTFKLPELRNRNIFCCDAFDEDSEWARSAHRSPYNWVIGNPPWKEIRGNSLEPIDRKVFEWVKANKNKYPTGGNQIAEAFAWRACNVVAQGGAVGLLLPAMTLFKYESRSFRKAFLKEVDLWAVANFANLAEVLFAGRSRVPAAAFFYSPRGSSQNGTALPETVEVYSPFVANQISHTSSPGRRQETWNIVVNASEIRRIPYSELFTGDALPWKLSMWGSRWDQRLLSSISRRFPKIADLEHQKRVIVAEGLEIRSSSSGKPREALEPHPELAGRPLLDVSVLRRRAYLFSFPGEAITRVPTDHTFVRKGRFELPLSVSRPPHVIVSAGRTFSVFSDDFLIVPPRQIGIAGERTEAPLLKALSLYLCSDFARYHQFLTSPQFGVQRERATLQALRLLPIPFVEQTPSGLADWENLHNHFVKLSRELHGGGPLSLARENIAHAFTPLFKELNKLTNQCLKLDARGRATVSDLVNVRLELNDGKVGKEAVREPSNQEIQAYGSMLRSELDAFLGEKAGAQHIVTVVLSDRWGMVQVELAREKIQTEPVQLIPAGSFLAREFTKISRRLLEQRSQFLYFNRDLHIFEGDKTYTFKPMQRVHWTQSQAIMDAGEIIAETLEPLRG